MLIIITIARTKRLVMITVTIVLIIAISTIDNVNCSNNGEGDRKYK